MDKKDWKKHSDKMNDKTAISSIVHPLIFLGIIWLIIILVKWLW